MTDQTINCPQCGAALPLSFRYTKLTNCDHCDSSIFLEDDGAKLAGKQSVMADYPSLLRLKSPFEYKSSTLLPVGHIRYRYDHGYWDEWWVLNNEGKGIWLSVDEGDYAFEKPVKELSFRPSFSSLNIGQKIDAWQVTELGQATCEAFRGELPEVIEEGEQFHYAHLSGINSQLMTLEYVDNTIQAYEGLWVDPFEVKIL